MATPETVADLNWYADTGATNHVTANLDNLATGVEYNGQERLMVGNGKTLYITHISSNQLMAPSMNKSLKLYNILRVPTIKKSLISISRLTSENNIYVEFHSKFLCC
ncbi:hypothetical protein TorRG33x02_073840, partial [Trema orientale]